jgi:alpha-glucosidase
MNYVGEKSVQTVSLDIFPSATPTGFTYYDDDGITYDYERGAYFSQAMTVQAHEGDVRFSIDRRTGTYTPPLRSYLCKFHCPASAVTVRVNGKTIPQYPDTAALSSLAGAGWATGEDTYGDVIWVKVPAGDAQKIEVRHG